MLNQHRLLTVGAAALVAVGLVAGIALVALGRDSTESNAAPLLQGDADCNQVVNALDALNVLEVASGSATDAQCVSQAGDANCNDAIDVGDAARILTFAALGQIPGAAGQDCPDPGTVVPTSGPTTTPTPSPTPLSCAGPGGGPTLPAGSSGTPQADAYDIQELLPPPYLAEASDSAIEFALIPGRPNEAVVVVQRGYVYRVALDKSFEPQLWGDIHGEVKFGGEEGLVSLAFSPNYQTDCRVYLYYTRGSPAPSVLSRFTATPEGGLDEDSEDPLISVNQPYENHNGGHIVFGNDGMLYLGYGDGGSGGDPEDRSQNMGTLLGKMIRIDVSGDSGYTIPADNPFANANANVRHEIYALGFRNPFRFTSDPVTGDIWIGDVGQNDWEEVDKLVKGGNFGWDCYEANVVHDYTGNKCDGKTFVSPRTFYGHVGGNQAITGGVIYRGDDVPELYGWFVYGDFASGRIWAVNPADSSDAVEIADTDANITSFTLAADGEIYVVTYNGGIYKLVR